MRWRRTRRIGGFVPVPIMTGHLRWNPFKLVTPLQKLQMIHQAVLSLEFGKARNQFGEAQELGVGIGEEFLGAGHELR